MTYVTEVIPKEDLSRLGFPNVFDLGYWRVDPYKWTVDRTTGTFLIESNHRDPDEPSISRFIFSWGGRQIQFAAEFRIHGEKADGLCWTWKLKSDFLHNGMMVSPSEESLSALRQAMRTECAHIHPLRDITFDF